MNPNSEESLTNCKNCGKVFDLDESNSKEEYSSFCCNICEAEYSQEIAEAQYEIYLNTKKEV